LLAHSYMLGANGDSNGCVSIKNYEKFLKAFNSGEIKRLVVVPSLGDSASTTRRAVFTIMMLGLLSSQPLTPWIYGFSPWLPVVGFLRPSL